jgi:hypothetical protein
MIPPSSSPGYIRLNMDAESIRPPEAAQPRRAIFLGNLVVKRNGKAPMPFDSTVSVAAMIVSVRVADID